jgi:formate dehydrogenase subunit delta
MSIEHLTQMANDIGSYFHAEPRREDAVAGIASHITRFWTPRMRQQIVQHLREGGEGLDDLPREAIGRLREAAAA